MSNGVRGLFAALLSAGFCCGAATALAQYFSPHVAPGSPYMQALTAGPMPADPGEQLMVMQTFLLADDLRSHNALQNYLVAQSLARIEGHEFAPSATVADAIARTDLDAGIGRIDKVIANAVQSTPVVDETELAPAFATRRLRASPSAVPGLWEAKYSGPQPDGVAAAYRVRNNSQAKITELRLEKLTR